MKSSPITWTLVLLGALSVSPALAGVPDVTQSFFVPQASSITTPSEGVIAMRFAKRCPNLDGNQMFAASSRLKIVVKASDGSPIAGIPASDICVLFNGGTPAQGFSGVGDDSIIANFQFNQVNNCPDIRCVQADGPTDAAGVAYISWIGHAAADPPGQVFNQVISRDPLRKWGGYAGDIPVMVLGFKLQGKLTTGGVLGSYTAHVKSLDHQGGRTTAPNQGEQVTSLDINPVQAAIGTPYKYALDFDTSGAVNSIDLNFVKAHNTHKCNSPIAN
jgi:hypothetical protein